MRELERMRWGLLRCPRCSEIWKNVVYIKEGCFKGPIETHSCPKCCQRFSTEGYGDYIGQNKEK